MRPAGRLVTIKRSGADGAHFPLSLSTCLFGRGTECDIRIQLPVVSKQHCKIEIKEQEAILCNFSSTNPTQVNGSAIQEPVPLKHGDIITIIDRSFRIMDCFHDFISDQSEQLWSPPKMNLSSLDTEYENESCHNGSKSTGSPGKACERVMGDSLQEPARRASRAGFSADPDGKEQDSKAHSKLTERNAWGKALEHAKKLTGDSSASYGADPEPPSVQSSEHQGHNGRNAGDPFSGDFKAKPRVTLVSSYGIPRSVPSMQHSDNNKRNESPFKKLYQSMKEELDAKPPGQNVQCHRKSGSQSDGTADREGAGGLQREPQLVLSCKSRRKSGRSTLMKEDPFPEPEASQTEKGSDVGPAESSQRLAGSSTPLSKMTREKAPVRCPHQPSSAQERKDKDLRVTLGESAGVKAVDGTVSPGKFLPRTQPPTKTEGAADPGKKPGNLSFRSRRSTPTNMRVLPTDIQSQPFLTQYFAQVERKIQKDSFNKPEKLGTAAGQICSGLPGLSSVDTSNVGDSINKNEDLSSKRRRVSFGGRLRPELFDENLPPNTPLKRGETPAKRKSLATHSPAVLKKIIKEQPASPGTESSAVCWEVEAQSVSTGSPAGGPSIAAPGPGGQRRRSGKASAASGGNKSPQDTAKKAGRKSGPLSSKRTSLSRSQHGILQMICSKRRSGASEANLIVAKSWADVVKLGAKQTQTKVVKHGPQRQTSRRQRRPDTPKKPPGSVHNQFSTGHANSPCTIIIGKAQIEKASVPARPYRMLNNLVFNQKMDYKEDLSGLTEMFKTPVKETTQMRTTSPGTLSNSENLLGKKSQVTNSGGKPLPITLEILGSNVFSSTQKTVKEPSDKWFASPSLRRQSIREDENTVKTPRSISKMTHFEMKTPGFSPEPLKMVSRANKLRGSLGLRNAEAPHVESKSQAEADAAEALTGRRWRETPRGGQGEGRAASATPEESTGSDGNCGKMANLRSWRTGGPQCEPTATLTGPEETSQAEPRKDRGSQQLPQTSDCTEEIANEGEEATNVPGRTPRPDPANPMASGRRLQKRPLGKVDMQEEASALRKRTRLLGEGMPTHTAPGGDDKSTKVFKGTPEQNKDPVVYGTGKKRGPRTPKQKTQPLEDLAGFKELFQTPKHIEEFKTVDKTKVLGKSPQPRPVETPTSTKTPGNTLRGKVDLKQEGSALEKFKGTPREATHTPTVPGGDGRAVTAVEEPAQQALHQAANFPGSRRQARAPREKAQPLEDLTGFQELFQTPGHGKDPKTAGKTIDTTCRSIGPEPGDTLTPSKRQPRASLQKLEGKEELLALRRLSHSPGRVMHTLMTRTQEEKGIRALGTPRQTLNLIGNLNGRKRQSRTPKERALSLEDLTGFQELFQTPCSDKDPKTVGETTVTACKSTGPEPGRAPASTKRRSKTSLGKVEVKEELSALSRVSQSPSRAMHTPTVPKQDRHIKAIMETPRQKLNLTGNLTGLKRQSKTPKERVQSLEDLTGFQELFQTPCRGKDPKTAGETTVTTCKTTGPEPGGAPASTKRRSKTSVGKVEVKEELSALSRVSQSPGRAMHTPIVPVQEEKGIRALTGTPRQKVNPAEDFSGLKRQPRTPKEKAQPLDDLTGFQELFQTPCRGNDPKTAGETIDTPCKSTGPEPVRAPASTRRRSKTSLGKVEVEEEASALRELTQMSGEATHTLRVPGVDDKAIRAVEEPAPQVLHRAAKVKGSRRQLGTPKEKAQPLEDLTGFQELFQTPCRGKDPKTAGETTDIPCRSAGPESQNTLTSSKRHPRTSLQKVEEKEELSSVIKLKQTLRATAHTQEDSAGDDKGIKMFKKSAKRKLDTAEKVTGNKRHRGAPKGKAQPLEDLAGSQELVQVPGPTEEPTSDKKTTEMPCRSPQPEPGDMPASTKRQPRMRPRVAEVKEEPVAVRRPTRATTHMRRAPGGEDQGSGAEGSAQQALPPTVRATGSRRRRGAPEGQAQPLEDMAGSKEPVQAPGLTEGPASEGKTTQIPCKSPQSEAAETPALSKRQPRTRLRKAPVVEELSAQGEVTGTSVGSMHTQREPRGDSKNIKVVKEPAKRKLDPTAGATGSKRHRGAPKEKAQPLEDLAGSQELIQAPGPTEEPTSDEKTTEMPCRSPQPEPGDMPASTNRQLRTRPRAAEVKEEPVAVRRPTRATTHMRRAPGGEDQGSGAEGSAQQALPPTVRVAGSRRRRVPPESQAQSGSKEPVQVPGLTEGPRNDAHSLRSTSKQTAERAKPLSTGRRVLRAPKEKPVEDTVGSGRLAPSQSRSSISLPRSESGKDGLLPGLGALCSETAPQDTVQAKAVHRKKTAAPRERGRPPEPLIMNKGLKILINRIEPVEEQSTSMGAGEKEQEVKDSAPADEGMLLRTRRQNKNEEKQQRGEITISAKKIKIKRQEKQPKKTSQEVELQKPDDGDEQSASRGRVREKRMCLRSGRHGEIPQSRTAEQEVREKSMAIPTRNQEEKGADSGFRDLRSRTLGLQPSVDSEPERRVTRAAKRCAGNLKKDKDAAGTKKQKSSGQ